MMVRDRILGVAIVVSSLLTLAAGQERPKWKPSQNYGLEGPIHTARNTAKKLNEDPREARKLSIPEPRDWIEFDPNGEVISDGNVDQSGKLTTLVRRKLDAQGRWNQSIVTEGDKTTYHRVERETLAGSTVTKTFVDDKLLARNIYTCNPQTGHIESKSFDANGKMTFHSIETNTAVSHEAEIWEQDGRFVIHTQDRYNDKGDLVERLRYDSQGKVVSDLSFKDEVLTSWWQDPKCDCSNEAGFDSQYDSGISYETTKEGKLLKTVQHHKGRRGNVEVDDEELYDENDLLLERIAYTYERDEHGNWTKRTSLVLDLKTRIMIPVREDNRKLTYY